ncbi:RING-H2 finger protein [Melia azedarach]|uniref:RING-H2 finger protein n=1 Tax=Melia azedarach TaxID=155640 RepID=A0ACC1XZR8_MELAZ|nr:RING-H2 finger protein [Melia azedarach]
MISIPPAYPPITSTTAYDHSSSPPSNNNNRLPVDFSPPLIAMVVVVATAFLIVTYSRLISRHILPPILRIFRRWKRWRRRRRRLRFYLPSSNGDVDSPPFYPSPLNHPIDSLHVYSPFGLDDSVIKTIPLSLFTAKNKTIAKPLHETRDCAVCLLEFEENDYVRTLPGCSHSFHVDCIDIWLRSHANCPLCRAAIFPTESPFVPIMAARIRPSLDDSSFLQHVSVSLGSLSEIQVPTTTTTSTVNGSEITPCVEDVPVSINNENCNSEERFNGRDFLLKRSYSFGFERSLASERMVTEAVTASPWRYRRGSFWSKRPSPFGSLTKPRVFSFRYYRGMKSPFLRRRGFFPLSESSVRFSGSSRRSKSMTSPMFPRSSAAAAFSSSRLRCGDPEALLSPDRFNRR